MKIKPLSDLHIDIAPYQDQFTADSKDTVLMLVGDTCEAHNLKRFDKFIGELAPHYKMVLIVLGNHEFYNSSVIRIPVKLKEQLAKYSNVKVLQRESIVIDDVTFIGATLWTDFNNGDPMAMWEADRWMNDFKLVRFGTDAEPYKFKFTSKFALTEHIQDLNFIKKAVKEATTKKIVVMTHHAPCDMSTLPEYKGKLLNFAYFTALEEYIYDSGITYWFHGHSHSSAFYQLEDTTVVANPRGYGFTINLENHAHLIKNPNLKGSIPIWELYGNQNGEFNPNLVLDI